MSKVNRAFFQEFHLMTPLSLHKTSISLDSVTLLPCPVSPLCSSVLCPGPICPLRALFCVTSVLSVPCASFL